jgi:outer membrane lipopolysaccharide assembly protein LptE/RlpB
MLVKAGTRHSRRAALACCGLWAIATLACGYALVGRGSNIPEDVQRVYLSPFENLTPRSQIEQFITQSIADELVTRRRFTLVGSETEADAVLSGAVVSYRATPLTFDASGRADEYEIAVTARVLFQRVDAEDPLWSNENYLFKENYELQGSEVDFFDRENLALEETARRFAETMVSDLLEGF